MRGVFAGVQLVIDWGRSFLENIVFLEFKQKNDNYLATDKNTSSYFWIHRNAPQGVNEALRILTYTGIVRGPDSGIKASRGEVGKRYSVNLGCLFGLEPSPASSAFMIADNLTPKRMTEYGANHPAFSQMSDLGSRLLDEEGGFALEPQFAKPVSVLDLTQWQKQKLHELGMATVGSVLEASEEDLMRGYYVGGVRARTMKNAASAAVLEYLSG